MRLEDLDYELPSSLIAQHPVERREGARLLVVERHPEALRDSRIAELPRWLRDRDALVLNETRVVPARLWVRRRPTGGRVEILFVRRDEAAPGAEVWRALVRPARQAKIGAVLESADGALQLEVVELGEHGERWLRIRRGDLQSALQQHGELPLPPYIRRHATTEDRERYQTVYARRDGAVAAPTAGLHFTEALLSELASRGVRIVRIVLHVGPGTFRPITTPEPSRHRMEEEYFEVPEEAVAVIQRSKEEGGRIVAVGTTTVRALESACDQNGGRLGAAAGWTRKFILPPYRFQSVDALLTNFHLPRTTLLLLVAAFAGEELTKRAYRHAVRAGYRFYSYGDAMLVA